MTFLGQQNGKYWLICVLQVVLKTIIGGLMLVIIGHVGIEFNGALKLSTGKCLPWWRHIWPGHLL